MNELWTAQGNNFRMNISGTEYEVDIYFTAVGMVNIPTETEMKAAMEEIQRNASRQSPHKNSSGTVHKCETVPLLI